MLIAYGVFNDLATQGQDGEAMNLQSMELALIFNNLNVEVNQGTPGYESMHPNGVFSGLLEQALGPHTQSPIRNNQPPNASTD